MSDFRARSSAEILDAAVEIYRRHFAVFFTAGVVYALPMALMQYGALSFGQVAARAAAAGAVSGTLSPASLFMMQGMMLTAWLVMIVIAPFTDGISVAAASRSYRGEPVDLADAARMVFARPLAVFLGYWARYAIVLVVALAVSLVIGIGFGIASFLLPALAVVFAFLMVIALFVVMIAVWQRYFAVLPAMLSEGLGVGDAMRRSRALASGHAMRVILLVGGVFLATIVFGLVLSGFIAALLSGVAGALVYLCCAALVNQFAVVVGTLLYFDLRIRKEGYDIELLAGSLAPSAGDLGAAPASA